MSLSVELMKLCAENEIILEVETGIVGGEEEGAAGASMENVPDDKLYTSPEDMLEVHKQLSPLGRFMLAATFGNVHGHYKPGSVKLRPDILKKGQDEVIGQFGQEAEFDLVFHGGSGTPTEEIRETLSYGVVKMNIDTDTQYAFSRPVVDHVMKNYDGLLKVDGEVGIQESLRPAELPQKGRRGDGRTARTGVRRPDVHRQVNLRNGLSGIVPPTAVQWSHYSAKRDFSPLSCSARIVRGMLL